MQTISVVTEAELRGLVRLDLDAVTTVEEAFRALAEGGVAMPPVMSLDLAAHNGEIDVKTAYIPGLEHIAIKISPGFFDNPKLGLPSLSGLMVVLSARTGFVQALLLDNGYLTDVRTAAAGAVAAKHLAREEAESAAILGAGMQARLQLEALTLVRPIRRARIWARRAEAARALAAELSERLGIDVSPAASVAEATKGVDIVVSTTPATEPIIEALEPGQHLTAVGSDAEHKNEVAPQLIADAALYVADRAAQTRRLGELHHAIVAQLLPPDKTATELGEICAGRAPARPDHGYTIADLTGTGVQDTAIANLALDRAKAAGVGTVIEN